MTDEKLIEMAERYERLDEIGKRQVDLQAAAIALYKAQQEQKEGKEKEWKTSA